MTYRFPLTAAVAVLVAICIPSLCQTLPLAASPTALTFDTVEGGTPPASKPVTLSLTDPHLGNVSYFAFPQGPSGTEIGWLSVNPSSGTVTTTPTTLSVSVDPTGLPAGVYTGDVVVVPSGGGSIRVAVTFSISAPLSLTPNCSGSTGIQGQPLTLLAGTVTGGLAPYSWSVSSGSLPAGLTINSGSGTISGVPTATGSFPITVRVADSGTTPQQTASYSCTIVVIPTLAITAPCPATPGIEGVSYTFPITVSGGTGVGRTWALASGALPSGLSLNTSTGEITGISGATGSFPISVSVTDTSQQVAIYSCSIVIAPSVLTITAPCPATVGAQGSPYSFPITVTGAIGQLTWALTSGSLPGGLSLNTSTGLISGTPTVSGSFPITVTVSDTVTSGAPRTATYSCSIVIAPRLTITAPCPVPTQIQGTPYSFPVTATGGQGPLTWQLTSGTLPAGLSLNPTTGLISGTPTAGGSFPITVTVRDSGISVFRQTATYSCSIVIISTLTVQAYCSGVQAVIGQTFSAGFEVGGGVSPYTFTLESGSLPPGLALNASTGDISGTPTSGGSFPFTVRITDAGTPPLQQTTTSSCSISVPTEGVEITSGCPVSPAAVGTPLVHRLTATGGDDVFIWTISVGRLPAGVFLRGSTISGTPTGPPGTANFSIQASSGEHDAQISCSLTITGPTLQITSGCPPNGTVGTAYTPFQLTATGGGGPDTYAFAIVNGSLPPGLSLNGSTISGTPQGPPGTASFSVQVTSGNETAASACSITIARAELDLTGTCPAAAFVGTPLSVPVTASGGTPPYTYTFSGSPWLSFAGNTVTGTPPDTGEGTFTVSAADATGGPPRTFSCSFPISAALEPVAISASCPAGQILVNQSFNLTLTGSGGRAPYTWSLSGPEWLSLSATTGASVMVQGTAPVAGAFPFTVTLNDSAGSEVATFTCTVSVTPLVITVQGACPAAPLDFQSSFTLSLSASGGTPPYNWTLTGPSWLELSSPTGANTTVSGTASIAGTVPFTVALSDGADSTPATFTCTLVVNPAVIPPIEVGGSPPGTILTPVPVVITLESPTPVPLAGTVRLTFTPNATNPIDNPQVHFSGPCLRECPFTIPAGSTTFDLPNIEQGTVAGTIRVEIVELRDAERNVLPSPTPFREIVVPPLRPVITAVRFENETTNGFDIVIDGYSTPRDVLTVTLAFAARGGATLEGDLTFSVTVSNLFTSFYQAERSAAGGSMFVGLRLPVSISGDKDAIGSVRVTLTNSVGASEPVTANR